MEFVELINKKYDTLNDFCAASKITSSYLRQIRRGEKFPSIGTLNRMATALNVSSGLVFAKLSSFHEKKKV